MAEIGTRERILDAAEALFAERGFGATSLRGITAHAGVNLASVNYHFGSKDSLVEQVFERRLHPLNSERLTRLDELEAAGDPALEAIVEAFVGPALRMADQPGGRLFLRLFGHTLSHPDDRIFRVLREQFRDVFDRFSTAIARAVPHVSQDAVLWRMLFMIGSMAHTLALSHKLPEISGGACRTESTDELIARLVAYAVGGLRAPVEVSR